MAKSKAPRNSPAPEHPAALPQRASTPWWRDYGLGLLLILALAATAFIGLHQPPLQSGKLVALAVLWIIAAAGLFTRLQARRAIRKLEAILAHDEIVHARLQPDITEEQSGLRMKHVSAWLVAGLGITASAVLWQMNAIERAAPGFSTLLVGAAVSIMFGLMVAANAINRLKTRRLMCDFRTALNSEQLALGTLGAVDVLISACLPTGERMRFNEHFLHFVGKSAAQMQGHGWLEVIHPDDRQAALDLVAKPLSNKKPRVHDLCVRHRDGEFVWLHEALAPRLDANGELIEFIGTAINITSYVENEAALDKQIGDLKTDLGDVKTKLDEARSELSKTKASRARFEKNLEESRAEVKTLQDALAKSETNLIKAKSDAIIKVRQIEGEAKDRAKTLEKAAEATMAKVEAALSSARQEHQQAAAENKKLTRAFEKLQEEMAQLRQQDGDLREQLARHIKETREAKAEATEARAGESQHRAKSDRMTQRCDELEKQLAANQKEIIEAHAQVQQASATITSEVERRLHEVSAEGLATQLRKQLDGVQRMTREMLAASLDGPVQDAVHNTAATVGAMSDLVNQALHRGGAISSKHEMAAAVSFDLRRTAQGVRDLLIDEAQTRGVMLELEFASNLPALVHGHDVEIRTALLSLTDAVIHLADDGTVILRLAEEISTGAHSTIRCELRHASARVKADALETALALKCSDDAMPDAIKHPLAHQAAQAWRAIRRLQGQHGFLLPDEGGFLLWFTFTLGRPAASARPASKASVFAASESITNSTEVQSDANDSRQMPRMPQELLNCNLGQVAELGADSIRIVCAKPPKSDDVVITFEDVETDLQLRAEILWSKKIAGRKHDVGLKFLSLTPATQKRILGIAMQHRKVKTMLDVQ